MYYVTTITKSFEELCIVVNYYSQQSQVSRKYKTVKLSPNKVASPNQEYHLHAFISALAVTYCENDTAEA